MNINFVYHGSTYKADLAKKEENKYVVLFKDRNLEEKFGSSLPFYIQNHTVEFKGLNRSHSDLYALSSCVSKAISEQCKDLL